MQMEEGRMVAEEQVDVRPPLSLSNQDAPEELGVYLFCRRVRGWG
jgi:hypothetical protein